MYFCPTKASYSHMNPSHRNTPFHGKPHISRWQLNGKRASNGENGSRRTRTGSMIERYAVYRVHLDPGTGSEMIKTRPAVVISDELMNRYLQTVVVCPITSRVHPGWPSRVQTSVIDK